MAQCLKRRKFRRESPEIFSVFRRRRPGADGGGVLPLSTHTKFFIFKTTFLINIGGGGGSRYLFRYACQSFF